MAQSRLEYVLVSNTHARVIIEYKIFKSLTADLNTQAEKRVELAEIRNRRYLST